jgi:hypothetical protein
MTGPRPTTAVELRRLLAEENSGELANRFVEHVQAAADSLPDVVNQLTVAEREQLVLLLFRLVGTGAVVH